HVVEDGHYRLSEAQARAILELRLHRLTGLEREKIAGELNEVAEQIEGFLEILRSREKLLDILRSELLRVRERFADDRRTTIEDSEIDQDIEDLIQREDMVVTVSRNGYVKRVPLSTYREQRRGGKGRSGMSTRDQDFVREVFVASTHTPVLFFSSRGIVYKLKVYRLPIGTPQARGKAFVNLLPLADDEVITTVMPLPEDEDSWDQLHVMFATASGNVRRNRLSDFTNVMANGKIAMKLEEGDSLVGVSTCSEDDDVLLATARAKCIRFPVPEVRIFQSRNSTGNRGIALDEGDRVISMTILRHADFSSEERDAYLRMAAPRRRGTDDDLPGDARTIPDERRFAEMEAMEEFLLTIATNGY